MDKEKIKAELEDLRPKQCGLKATKLLTDDFLHNADNVVYEQLESVNRPRKTVEMLISSSGVVVSDYVKTIDMFNHYGKNGMKWGNKK